MIHLDTGFLIRALLSSSPQDGRLREWLREGEPVAISAIAWAEFLCGPVTDRQLELAAAVLQERFAFAEQDAALAARLFNAAGRRRGTLVDCMIAASALRAGAMLATTNASDFQRFASAGLTLAS
jgi:predicted nucleic acid-binding protein